MTHAYPTDCLINVRRTTGNRADVVDGPAGVNVIGQATQSADGSWTASATFFPGPFTIPQDRVVIWSA